MGNATPDQMMSQMEAILSNPAMANMMQSMMSNPAVMQHMMDSDPRMRAMLDAAPGMREQLTNPEFLRQMTNPDNLRAMMQMQRAMTQLQGNGVMPGMGMPGAGGGGGAGAANPFAALMGGAQNPVADATPPEEAYASQLQQLKDMGFFDEAQNIRALQATFGNVSARHRAPAAMTTRRIAVSLIRNTRASSEGVNLNSRSETLLPFLGSRSRSRALVIVHVPPQPGSLHHRPALQALVHVPAHPRRRDARDGQPRHPIRVKVHPRRVVVAGCAARPRRWSRSQPMGPLRWSTPTRRTPPRPAPSTPRT